MAALLRALLLLLVCSALSACNAAPSALHEAAAAGDVAAVREWIRAGRPVDVDFDDHSFSLENNYSKTRGLRPLMVASMFGHLEVVKLLLDAGADLYAESRCANAQCNRSAFDYAVEHDRLEVARYLWERSDRTRLAQRIDGHLLSACLRYCNEAAGGDARSNLALFLAEVAPKVKLGRAIGQLGATASGEARLAFLRSHGVKFPSNTLHYVAKESVFHLKTEQQRDEQLQRARVLLADGADPNDNSWVNGITPLMLATFEQNLPMVQLLVSHGARPDVLDEHGQNALGWVMGPCSEEPEFQRRQLALVDFLLSTGTKPALGGASKLRFVRETCCTAQRRASAVQAEICRKLDPR